MQRLLRILPALVILGLGYLGWKHYAVPETAEQSRPKFDPSNVSQRAIETEAIQIKPTDHQVQIRTQGIVQANIATPLNAQVSGKITSISANFQDGAFFQQDQILVTLEDDDYKAEVITAEAALARSQADLAQEQARAEQALRNWEDIGFDTEPNDLVLRVPQLREAKANVKSAQAKLEKVKRNLERTKVRAPYNGRVRSRLVGLGQSISTNTRLGEIYSTEKAKIRLPLSSRQLDFIELSQLQNQQTPIPVVLTDDLSIEKHSWNAQIIRAEGELDSSSRELFVIAEINDPFGLNSQKVPLQLNQSLNAVIMGKTLEDVLVIPRNIVYEGTDVVAIINNKAEKHQLDVLWSNSDSLIVHAPELHNQQLATRKLGFVAEGSKVNIVKTAVTEAKQPNTSF